MHDLRCVTSPLCAAHIWPIVNADVSPGAAYLAAPQRAGSSSLPASAPVRVSEVDRLFGALGMKLV